MPTGYQERPLVPLGVGDLAVMRPDELSGLLAAIQGRGYTLLGPTVRDAAIVYGEIAGADDLPIGWTDEQSPGSYRLTKRSVGTFFGYAVGPHSWKATFHRPELTLWQAERQENGGFTIHEPVPQTARVALIGVRACELAAIRIQDRVLLEGPFADPHYAARRRDVFVVAVNCTEPGATCFCASLGTGPSVGSGFDLALTEVVTDTEHFFVAEIGSSQGAEVLGEWPVDRASRSQIAEATARTQAAADRMGRSVDARDVKEVLARNLENPRWQETADRCLGCTNCTQVCPTCFCTAVHDLTDLSGRTATRVRQWDSCFTRSFSYVHGGSVRRSGMSRYRQWLTHKLSYWADEFGSLGCVGCGRCITWCPKGIDLTEEIAAIRALDQR